MPAPPALFNALIDYAGLFPPAKLPMPEAVRHHAAYLRGLLFPSRITQAALPRKP